jgi:O-antigen ligase
MDRPALAVALLGLLLAPLVGWLVLLGAVWLAAGVVVLFAGFFLLGRPKLALYLLVVGALFNPFYVNAGFAKLGAGDLAMLIILPVWVARRLFVGGDLRLPVGWPLLAAYVVVAGVSLLLGADPAAAQAAYLRELTYVAALVAGVDLTRDLSMKWRPPAESLAADVANFPRLFGLMCLCGLVLVIHALATWPGGRMVGMIGQPNGLAFILALCLWPTFGLALRAKPGWKRTALFGAFGLMVLGVVLTISRSNYLGMICAALWSLRHYRRLVVVAVVVVGSIVVVLSLFPEATGEIAERWQLQDRSVSQRLLERDNAVNTVFERPWLGVGFGQFERAHMDLDVLVQVGRAAHNQYLSLPAEVGIPGALLLFGFVFMQFRVMWGRASAVLGDTHRWILVALQALAVHQSVTLMFRDAWRQPEWAVLYLYCALAAIVAAPRREAPTG